MSTLILRQNYLLNMLLRHGDKSCMKSYHLYDLNVSKLQCARFYISNSFIRLLRDNIFMTQRQLCVHTISIHLMLHNNVCSTLVSRHNYLTFILNLRDLISVLSIGTTDIYLKQPSTAAHQKTNEGNKTILKSTIITTKHNKRLIWVWLTHLAWSIHFQQLL